MCIVLEEEALLPNQSIWLAFSETREGEGGGQVGPLGSEQTSAGEKCRLQSAHPRRCTRAPAGIKNTLFSGRGNGDRDGSGAGGWSFGHSETVG